MEKTKPVPERVTMDGGIGIWGSLAALVLIALLTVLPLKAVGAESAFDCGTIACDPVDNDVADKASLQRGAQIYMNYCMGCHALQYARYERTATDLGIPEDLFQEHLLFDKDAKFGDLMTNSMSEKDGKKWFGAAPPDLTLIARARGTDWLYTYLRNFYDDPNPSRPYGVNNRVFPDVGMPNVLLEMEQSLEPEEFDLAMTDLVNFLDYTAEPMQLERERTGICVLLYLALLFVFAYLLNRGYKQQRQEVQYDQGQQNDGECHNMQCKKSVQGDSRDEKVPSHPLLQISANNRNRAHQRDDDLRTPVGHLAPRQDIAHEGFGHQNHKYEHPEDPDWLSRLLIGTIEQGTEHVQINHRKEGRRPGGVHIPDDPAVIHIPHDVFNGSEGTLSRRVVAHGKPDAGEQLVYQDQQRQHTEKVPKVKILGRIVLRHMCIPGAHDRQTRICPVPECSQHFNHYAAS